MLRELIASLEKWNATKSERQKLQYAYLILMVVIVFAAGLISLVNADLGHTIVMIGFAALVIFVINGVVWNLVDSIVLRKLGPKSRRK